MIKPKPKLGAEDFIKAGDGGKLNEATPEPIKNEATHKKPKLYQLSVDLIRDLRNLAHELSNAEDRRVTETEIVEKAIREYINKYRNK